MLTRMSRTFERNYIPNIPEVNDINDSRRIYLDSIVYTVILNNDGAYQGVINHTPYEEIEEEKIEKIANKILNNHKDDFYIGNLYTNKYSYAFTQSNTLIIIDNTEINSILLKDLISNILLFLVCEIIIVGFTYVITKWIITPVSKSFERQKVFVADASH